MLKSFKEANSNNNFLYAFVEHVHVFQTQMSSRFRDTKPQTSDNEIVHAIPKLVYGLYHLGAPKVYVFDCYHDSNVGFVIHISCTYLSKKTSVRL